MEVITDIWRELVGYQPEPEEWVHDPGQRWMFGLAFPSGPATWESHNPSPTDIRVTRKRQEVHRLLQHLLSHRTILTTVGIWVAYKILRQVSREVVQQLDLCTPISPETVMHSPRSISVYRPVNFSSFQLFPVSRNKLFIAQFTIDFLPSVFQEFLKVSLFRETCKSQCTYL